LSGLSMATLQPLSVLVAYSVYCPMMQSNAELGAREEVSAWPPFEVTASAGFGYSRGQRGAGEGEADFLALDMEGLVAANSHAEGE